MSCDQTAVFQLVRTYGSHNTPTVVIGDEVIIGFNPQRYDELLEESV